MSSARFVLSAAGIFAINVMTSQTAAFDEIAPCPKARFEKISADLGLDVYQASTLEELLQKHRLEIRRYKHDDREERAKLREKHMAEVAVILTEHQMQRFREIRPLMPRSPRL